MSFCDVAMLFLGKLAFEGGSARRVPGYVSCIVVVQCFIQCVEMYALLFSPKFVRGAQCVLLGRLVIGCLNAIKQSQVHQLRFGDWAQVLRLVFQELLM